jgi:hypothetical protein
MAIQSQNSGSGSSGNGMSVPVVNDQLIASYGSVALNNNLQSQNVIQVPNYKNLDISSLTLQLSVSSTTTATAPSGVVPIESVIKGLEIQSMSGKDIWRPLDGSLFDISNYARYLNPSGVVNNSPFFPTAVSTTATTTWNINIPFGINNKHFPLKLFVTFNTLGSTASTLNGMTVTVNSFSILASYHKINPADIMLKPLSVPITAAGNISLQQYYDIGHTYYSQILNYGNVQESTASDSPIGSTGTGIVFTPDGSLYMSNVPLQAFIQKENNTFPNTVSAGVGHEVGMVNMFTNPFVASAASQLSIDFTSVPNVALNTQTLRLLNIESL